MKVAYLLLKTHLSFVLFTLMYCVFFFATYKDCGITFDEQVEYDAGAYVKTYISNTITQEYVDKMMNHGPVNIETRHLPIFAPYSRIYTFILTLLNPRFYYEWFHLLNLAFGFLLFLLSYLLFLNNGVCPRKAVVAPISIFLTPYILGHIPGNPKDIPFAWAYLGSLYFINLFGNKKTDFKVKVIILGALIGLSTALRAVGLTLLVVSFLFDTLYSKNKLAQSIVEHVLITLISFFIWIILMPWLGVNFYANLVTAVFNASGFSEWKGTIFYLGEFLNKSQRPWHYLFVILGVKLPIPFVVLFLFGSFSFIKKTILKLVPTSVEFLLFTAIYLNFFVYLVTHPVVYNGIRHFLYLVVLIVLFSSFYLVKNWKSTRFYKTLLILIFVYFGFTGIRMIHLHPYEYVYFNELTGGLRGAQKLFQLDYWGASYKTGSEYAIKLAEDRGIENLKVFSCDSRFAVDYYSKGKYQLVGSPKESDILLCDNFRDEIRQLKQPIIYEVKREGVTLLNIRAQQSFVDTYNVLLYR